MRSIIDDFSQAWRAWKASLKIGGSTIPVIVTLGLAMGASTALFLLMKGLLSVLPYHHPEELVLLWERVNPNGPKQLRLSIPDYLDFAAQNHSFAQLAVFTPQDYNFFDGGTTERISGAEVSGGFFDALGVQMLKGRDARPDDKLAVLLSEDLWRRRFPGWMDPIGRTVRIDGVDRTIIGIVPHEEEFPPASEIWVPFAATVESCACKRNGHSYEVIGRLKPETSLPQADVEMKTIAARLAASYPDSNTNTTAWVQPLREKLIGEVRPATWMLAGATGCLLLMACVSVATILFARATSRGPEIAMRQVLGATRARIIVQLVLESAFSALVASALGILVGWWLLGIFLRIVPGSLTHVKAVSIDPRAVGFAGAMALLTVLIFSLVPALSATRTNLLVSIRSGDLLPSDPGRSQKFRNGLIILENSVAFVLLVTSILLLNSLLRLTSVNPGFEQRGTISGDLNLNSEHYSSPQSVVAFYTTLLNRVGTLPGVESAAAVDSLPMTGSTEGAPYYPVGTFHKKPGEEPIARVTFVTPGYFKTMGVPLLRGRDFDTTDGQQSHVMIISEGIARANWPNENAIGKHVGIRGAPAGVSWEVIGVVPDIKDDGLASASPPRLYLNEQEVAEKAMTVVIRARGDLKAIIGPLRHEVSALDATVPVYNIKTVEDLVNGSLARNRTVTRIVTVFSVMALILAAVGVYGVILSTLMRRTWEFGIRLAVGASFRHIAWLVLREGFLLVFIGIATGLLVTFASSRVLSSFVFGIAKSDISSYLIAAATQLVVVACGCLAVLHRITKLDPAAALKNR